MGQRARLHRMFIIFRPNSIVLASEMAFFWNFLFWCSFFFLHWNSYSRKFVQLFDWKWVNEQDSASGSLFFGQNLLFRPPKWHFFENFCFDACFIFAPKFRFTQICATFRLEMCQRATLCRFIFGLRNGIYSKNFVSILVLIWAKIHIRKNLCNFSIGNGSTDWTP